MSGIKCNVISKTYDLSWPEIKKLLEDKYEAAFL